MSDSKKLGLNSQLGDGVESDGFIYTRPGNLEIGALEKTMAALEGGYGGMATSSGMGAISTVYMSCLAQEDHMVSHDFLYGPSRTIMETLLSGFGIQYSYVDATDIEHIRKAIRSNTRLISICIRIRHWIKYRPRSNRYHYTY